MADGINIDPGSTTEVATDDCGAAGHTQIVKLAISTDGSATLIPASGTDGLLVNLGSNNDVTVSDGGNVISVDDGSGSLTVDNAALSVTGGGVESTALRVTVASDSTGVLSVDDNGGSLTVDVGTALPAGTNNIGDVDVLSVVPGTAATSLGKAEDAAHSSGDTGVMALAVRDSAGTTTFAGTDGDYSPLSVTAAGHLWTVNPAIHVEDTAHSTGHQGTMVLGVRNDAGTTLAGTDGDYIPLSIDSAGALRVTGGGGGTQYTEGDTDSSITGTAILWEDTSETLRAVSAAKPLPVSDAGGALTVDNGGTFAVQVDGAALTALQLLDDAVVADDAAFTPGTTKVHMAGFQADEAATDSVDEGDGGAARMTLDRKVIVNPQPHTAGGLSIHKSLDLDESEEEVKATAGQVYGWYIANLATTTRFVKFYNDTAANVSVGTTTPVMTLPIPGNSTDDVGANALGAHGITFSTAICVAATTGLADNDTGAPSANDVVANIFFK